MNAEGQASYTHVHEVVEGLVRRGWSVDLRDARYRNARPGTLRRLLKVLSLQVGAARRGDVDVVYYRMHALAWPLAWWCRRRGVAVVCEINGPTSELFTVRPWLRPFARIVQWTVNGQLAMSSAVVAVTPELGAWAQARGATRVAIIPNGANVELFAPGVPAPRGLPSRYALYFGVLAPWQGLRIVMDAVESADWPDDLALVVIGDGDERPLVEAVAARSPRVDYLGPRPYRELPGYVANSVVTLSVQTDVDGRSRTGLLPLKLFESMAAGVPVVVSDTPGQGELVTRERCGLVVPAGEVDALARAVRTIAADADAAAGMGGRGRVAAVRDHSWDARAEDTHRLLMGIS
jgi:glycosyltransferase involved in cell wall biosynthesis